ncbi:MAG: hypothetical protein AB1451_10000 [Nitrospirota bacterium]
MKTLFRRGSSAGGYSPIRKPVAVVVSFLLLVASLCPVSVSAMSPDVAWTDPGMAPMSCPVQLVPCTTLSTAFQSSVQHLKSVPGHSASILDPDGETTIAPAVANRGRVSRDSIRVAPLRSIPLYLLHASLIR